MKKYEILDASKKMRFHAIYEAINDCMGTDYTGWMKACWPNVKGNGKFRLWFPKLAEQKDGVLTSAAFDCVNTISDDWNELIFDDLKRGEWDLENAYLDYDLIFAKDPYGGDYIFRGVYKTDLEKTKPYHSVSKRVATKVKTIGTPAYDIELLDAVDYKTKDINTPIPPLGISADGSVVICPRCETKFKRAERCPDCGQLIKYPAE